MTQTEDEDAYRVITALHLSRKFLTVATYYELTNSIILDNFPSSKTEMQNITDFIKSVTATTNFIFSATILANKDLLDLFVGENPPIPYQSIKSSCWQESNAKEFILRSLRVRSSHYGDCETNIMIYLSQVCDIECQETIQTLGALAYYLSKNIFQLDQDRITVSSISPFPRDSLLRMDQNTYRSLQIFKEDFHPNWIRGKGKSKEGFSIFAMFDRTLTSPGRRKLYEWMKSPTYALNVIVSRQEDVDFFLRNDQQDTTNKLSEHLRHTADMPHLMMKMMKASMNPIDWCKLQRTLKEWIAILEITYEQVIPFISNESNILRTFSGKSVQDTVVILSTLINTIDCILDISQCERENSIVIVRGYNDILDLKKEKYEAIEQELIRAAELILKYTPPLQVTNSTF
jgi:DNA mismatch repair protein MSH5